MTADWVTFDLRLSRLFKQSQGQSPIQPYSELHFGDVHNAHVTCLTAAKLRAKRRYDELLESAFDAKVICVAALVRPGSEQEAAKSSPQQIWSKVVEECLETFLKCLLEMRLCRLSGFH